MALVHVIFERGEGPLLRRCSEPSIPISTHPPLKEIIMPSQDKPGETSEDHPWDKKTRSKFERHVMIRGPDMPIPLCRVVFPLSLS
jgi:hypothetical protein